MRKIIPLLAVIVLTAYPTAIGSSQVETEAEKRLSGRFLKARGTELWLGGRPYRNVGANTPDLFVRFLLNEDAQAERSLDTARAAGIRFVRCFGATWGTKNFDIFERDRRRWLSAYERMLTAADRRGIKVVPSLLFNSGMIPAYVRQNTGRDEQVVEFLTPRTRSNDLAVEYVTTIVDRYKDDPRILFWEIGNEYNLMADLSAQWRQRPANQIPTSDHVRAFVLQIGTLIKKLDKNHMVTAGHSEMRPYAWHIRQSMLAQRDKPDPTNWKMDWTGDTYAQYVEMTRFYNPPPLDLISIHHYPMGDTKPPWLPKDDTRDLMLEWSRMASDEIGKPLFVGEFGQPAFVDGKEQDAPFTRDILRQVQGGIVSVTAFWTWEFESKDDPVGQGKFALSFEKTPALARRISEVNRSLLGDSSTGNIYVALYGTATAPGTPEEPRSLASVICAECSTGTVWLLPGVYPGDKTIAAAGITLRSLPGTRAKFDGRITIAAPDVTIQGLDIFDSSWTNRSTQPTTVQRERRVNVTARRVKIIDNYIHDLASGIEAYNGGGGATADLLVARNLFYNIGWEERSSTSGRWEGQGSAIGSQNDSVGVKTLTDNVFVNQYGFGLSIYGSRDQSARLERFRVKRNVHINNRWLMGGGRPLRDVHVIDNRLWQSPLQMGYQGKPNEDVMVQGNWVGQAVMQIENVQTPTVRLNRSASNASTNVTLVPPQGKGLWNDNAYWHPPSSSPFEINGVGFFTFAEWQAKTGWDGTSVFTPTMPTENWIDVWSTAPHHGIAVIYNWTDAQTVVVDLQPLGLTAGASYELVSVQNPAESLEFVAGKSVSVPMTGWTVATPYGTPAPRSANTFPEFGAFLIEPARHREEKRAGLPDLAPVPDPRPGVGVCKRDDQGRLLVTVRNTGPVGALASTTTVEFLPGGSFTLPTPAIPAGGSADLPPLGMPGVCFSPDCTFKITVDSTGQVNESNEGNNNAGGKCLG